MVSPDPSSLRRGGNARLYRVAIPLHSQALHSQTLPRLPSSTLGLPSRSTFRRSTLRRCHAYLNPLQIYSPSLPLPLTLSEIPPSHSLYPYHPVTSLHSQLNLPPLPNHSFPPPFFCGMSSRLTSSSPHLLKKKKLSSHYLH